MISNDEKIADFLVKQEMPYEFKKTYAYKRAWEFYDEINKMEHNCHVSVGGLDSITLFLFLKSIGIHVPAISVSGLEDISIQKIHKELGVIRLKPAIRKDGTHWNKATIIQEFGFPVISKRAAEQIEVLQNPTKRNVNYRHSIITGEIISGVKSRRSKYTIAKKWLELFGGYENENYNVNYKIPPFKVSKKCCYYLKEKPCTDWANEHNSHPYLGLMASEGGKRRAALSIHGCNYFGKTIMRSAPFAIFNRQDLLQLALELEVPIPEIYGEIKKDKDGNLYTTKAQRTGCGMCGFGIHLEKRPHRFDQLKEQNQKAWEYWMYHCVKDEETGEEYGWGRVLDYIGVEWETPIGLMKGQMELN